MIPWIEFMSAVATLFLVLAAILKHKAKSQPIGALVVIVLGMARGIAVFAGYEMIADISFYMMTGVAILLLIIDLRWKEGRQSN
ncbi:hypothetical protein [Alcaligenes faecalis]|uniref:hypothetical protein n=1 Tax=Alcaligenes faecalis TaxID=511 RepID=UPI0034D7109B